MNGKTQRIMWFFSLLLFVVCSGNYAQTIRGPFFGQTPPGRIPALFAPELFNHPEGYHSAVVFSPDGTEAYFTPMARHAKVYGMKMVNGIWKMPQAIDFSVMIDGSDPTISGDGRRLYFLSFKAPETDSVERERIWYSDRIPNGWSHPQLIAPNIAAHATHWTFSVAANGNLYFTSEKGDDQDIYISRFQDGRYLDPVNLGASINTRGKDLCPFIATDERYLVFSRIGDGTQRTDLYVSFKTRNNTWSPARSLGGNINSDGHDLAPVVTHDGKYLIFLSSRSGVIRMYWVDATVIEELRSKDER